MKISRKPHKAAAFQERNGNTKREAWWYENPKSIDIYVYDPDLGKSLSCRITRANLQDWLKRTA